LLRKENYEGCHETFKSRGKEQKTLRRGGVGKEEKQKKERKKEENKRKKKSVRKKEEKKEENVKIYESTEKQRTNS
jgi:cytochrome c-type biogenesis protein CcmH/NrfG